jgi:hypothetical protein
MLDRWRLHAGVRQGLLVLALLVLLAQSLGLAHRFAHASALGLVQAQAMAEGSPGEVVMPSTTTPAPWGWVFGEHTSTADCQLYDQLCHEALGLALACVLVFAMCTAWLPWPLRERLALHARFFSARAPPAVLN